MFIFLLGFNLNSLFANPDSLVISCQESIIEYTEINSCYKSIEFEPASIISSCGPYSIQQTEGSASGENFIAGSHTISWSVIDSVGNQKTCSFEIIIQDSIIPSIQGSTENLALEKDGNCTVGMPNLSQFFTVEDNCNVFEISQSIEEGEIVSEHNFQAIFSAEDLYGNESLRNLNIEVYDVTIPYLECPSTIIKYANNSCSYILEDLAAGIPVSDNCGITSVSQSMQTGEVLSIGEHIITFEATDNSFNSTTCEVLVNVVDTIAPIAICPENDFLDNTIDCMAVLPNYANELITFENCNSTLNISQFPEPGAFISNATNISFFVSDENGNIGQCSFLVEKAEVDDSIFVIEGGLMALQDNALYQWMDCINIKPIVIPGETQQTFYPEASGSYALSVTVGSCTLVSSCLDLVISSELELTDENIVLYPNPSKDFLNIELPSTAFMPKRIEIIQQNGSLVLQKDVIALADLKLDIGNLEKGIYTLKIVAEESLISKKIIIE
ncbi:MAG: HYR domain-containing protein [Bacteroidota bacterium]